MRARPLVATAATLSLTCVALAGASVSTAAPDDKAARQVTVVAKNLVGPLSVAEAPDGTRYWADTFAGRLYRQPPGGLPVEVVYKSRKAAPEGVSADGGVLRFTTGSDDNKKGNVWTLGTTGDLVKVANIAKYEKSANPDADFHYGFLNTPRSCLRKLPRQIPGSYTGVKESHPYATATSLGYTFVADAGANAIFAVSPTGDVSTVTALKPVKVTVTRAGARANGLPRCTIGRKFALEAVPTDIEVGPDGLLYVTSLPGGPEDGSLGANGRVLTVNVASGRVKTLADHLISPTGVAVATNGDVFVAQLFKGEISRIKAGTGKVKPYLRVPLPAAVEATPTGLLATIKALPGRKPKGQVVTIAP